MPIFKGSNGLVHYNTSQMPNCCGVCVVHTVIFDVPKTFEQIKIPCKYYTSGYDRRWKLNEEPYIKAKNILYKEFNEFLERAKNPYNLNRCKLVMSDRVWPSTYINATIYDFCTTMKWKKIGTEQYNGRSGNRIQLFELNREYYKPKGYNW